MAHGATPRSARGVYGISVASELSGLGPQTLRLYERWGLLTPYRTDGGTRRYSDDDLTRLKRISELVDRGINLAGVLQILDLEDKNSQLELDNSALRFDNTELRARHASPSKSTASRKGRRGPVMTDVEGIPPVDEIPEADALDQQRVVVSDDETGLDTSYAADAADREANPADVIDQAIVVPVPDDD